MPTVAASPPEKWVKDEDGLAVTLDPVIINDKQMILTLDYYSVFVQLLCASITMSHIKSAHSDESYPELEETRIDGETVFEGNFLQIQRDNVRLPNGKTASREFVRHPGAVVVLPVFEDGTVLLERQFRYPIRSAVLEFPAGKIDAGEDILACAKRELQEETGYTARNWQYVCRFHNALGYSDEFLDIFLARDLTAGENNLDEEEFIETMKVSVDDLLEWVQSGSVTDVKTIVGTFWLEKVLAGQWELKDVE